MPRSTDTGASGAGAGVGVGADAGVGADVGASVGVGSGGDAGAGDAHTGSDAGARVAADGADAPGAAAVLARLLAGIERELPGAIELRHELHAHPELAHSEHRTAATVAEALPVSATAIAGAGRIARIGRPDAAAVAVRAELDGLPIAEHTGAPFSADPALGAMHACGHDVHMAALVALARAAHTLDREGALPAPLLVVLQPSEEAYPSGADQLVRDLVAGSVSASSPVSAFASRSQSQSQYPTQSPSHAHAPHAHSTHAQSHSPALPLAPPTPGAIVAAHIHPELPWGAVALDPGTVNASCDHVEIRIEGEPAHGAYPHRGSDPILALAEAIVSLHAQLGRRIDPLHPATLTVGVIEGGSAENVIPGSARARASLRAYRPEDRQALRKLVEDVVTGVARAHGARGAVKLTAGEPALANDLGIVARARELLTGAGLDAAPPWRSCGSDDFAFFGALGVPLAMGFVGLDGAKGFTTRPLHHPELLVPDAAVGAVARVLAVLYLAATSLLAPAWTVK